MKSLLSFFVMLFTLNAYSSFELENSKKQGEINFVAVGKPAMIKIKGVSHAPITKAKISDNKMSVESILVLNDLDTGIELRDEHMKEEYLQVKKYPTSLLKISNIILPNGFEQKPTKITDQNFQGKLTLHGKEHDISGVFSLNESLELVANFNIKLTDYGIEIPNYLGVVVADSVTINTKINLIKKL